MRRASTSNSLIDRMSWPVWLVQTSTFLATIPFQFECYAPRPGSRRQRIGSCARCLVSWLPTYFTTVSRWSMLLPDIVSLRMLWGVVCSCLKGRKERIMFGTISTHKGRRVPSSTIRSIHLSRANPRPSFAFSLNLPISAHRCLATISHCVLPPFGSTDASFNRSLNRSPFPSRPHGTSVLPFSHPRSKRQLGT